MVRRVANNKEHHSEQFRGTWIGSRVWRLFWAKRLTMKEMVLLAAIDVLSSDEEGCWASNEYFAEHLSITPNGVGNMITKLVKRGYLDRSIKRTQKGTKRFLSVVSNPRTPCQDGVRTPSTNGVLSPPSEGKAYSIGGDDILCGGQAMPFMKEFEKETVEDIHHQRAARLIGGLRKSMRLTGPANASKWAVHFKRLHKDLEGDDARIDAVLMWFLNNIKNKYTPRVWSASSFRTKFIPIEDAMTRANGNQPSIDIEITPIAVSIANRLRMKSWPKGSAEELPVAVQLSLTSYDVFLFRLRQFGEKLPGLDIPKHERDRLARFVSYLMNGGLPGATHYIEQWMSDVNEQIASWDAWSGDLIKLAFRTDSKTFKRYGRALTSNYCGETKPWDRIMELMYADPET